MIKLCNGEEVKEYLKILKEKRKSTVDFPNAPYDGKDLSRCNALLKKRGKFCARKKVRGTAGCKIHHANRFSQAKAKGKYEDLPNHLDTKYNELLNDTKYHELKDEIALLRAMTKNHIKKYPEDVDGITRLIESLRKNVDTSADIAGKKSYTIKIEVIQQIIKQIVIIIINSVNAKLADNPEKANEIIQDVSGQLKQLKVAN